MVSTSNSRDARKAGNVAGRSELELAFTDLEIQGRLFPIQTQQFY